MGTVFVLLVVFLGIGLFARTYNTWIRVLLLLVIVGVLVYISLA
jgi:hypothetical protein